MNHIQTYSEFRTRANRCTTLLGQLNHRPEKARSYRLILDYVAALDKEFRKANNAPIMSAWDMLNEL